jgi:hypothetical protein
LEAAMVKRHGVVGLTVTHHVVLPDGGELVCGQRVARVGDRGVPQTVTYRHSGDADQPAREVRVEIRNGIPICAELRLTANDEGAHVRAKDIKVVAAELERSISYWLSELAYVRNQKNTGYWRASPPSATDRRVAQEAVERARRQTRRKMSDELLARVADTVNAAPEGSAKHETVAIAFSVSPRTAQRFIAKAREAGYLPAATRRAAR